MTDVLHPYPEYKASGVPWLGEIPAHWRERRAKYFFREVDERSSTGDEELLSVSHVTGVTPRSQKNVTMFMAESYVGHKLCRPADLVINTMWAWMSALGVAKQPGIVSPAYAVYRPTAPGAFLPEFVDHLLRTQPYASEYWCRSTGIRASRLRLYPEEFLEIPIACPPQPEQDQILVYLEAKDQQIRRFIRAKRRLIELLNEQKQAIIHRTVTLGLDPSVRLKPSGMDWLGDVPEHWEVWQIGHFAKVGNGSTPSRGNVAYWSANGYPWLNSASVNQGTITRADQFVTDQAFLECHLPTVEPGSVLVAITGQGRTRGTAAVLAIEATINQHVAYISPRTARVSSDYLQMYLTAAYAELRAVSDDSGSTRGALTCEGIKRFKVVLPPADEQDRLVSWLRRDLADVEATIARIQHEMDLVGEYRTRLIADVVTGKLDVRNVDLPVLDEAGSVDDAVLDDEEVSVADLGAVAEDAANSSEE